MAGSGALSLPTIQTDSEHSGTISLMALPMLSKSPTDFPDDPVFLLVRPAGRTHLEVKVLYSPDKGKS